MRIYQKICKFNGFVANKRKPCFCKLVFIIALGLILVLSFTVTQTKANDDKSLEKVRLQLKWIHQFNFAGYYAAIEKGFYREAGLEVELIEGKPGVNFFEEVLSGRAEYGIEMPELLLERNKGKPLVVLAVIFQHSPQILITRKDSGLKTPQDIIGHRVMLRFDSAAELRAMLINEGVPPEDIQMLELSWNINDLIDKKVDTIHAYLTGQPFTLQEKGVPYTVIRPLTYGIDFYGDCLFTSEKELREHPERVRAFRQASLRGWVYAMDNPEEIIDIILNKYSTKSSRKSMQYEWKVINKLILPKLVEIGHMNPGRWKHIGDTFVKLGMLEPDYSLKGFIYDPNPKPDYKWVYWTIGIIVVILLIIGVYTAILFVFNKRLHHDVQLRTSEISQINKTLVQEASERKQAENELESYRKHLEKLVNERTRELENAQEELVRKERLAVLGQLTATVSHEIRNPLGTLRNAVFSIGEAIKHNEMERVGRSLKLAERNIKRCVRIINELLDFTRSREIMFEKTDIDSWLSDVLDEQQFPVGIKCVRELHSGVILPIDREYMRRAVENVVINANQALQDENSRGNQLKVKSAVNGERLELCFTDTGPGIPEEIMEKIFEPLFSTRSFGIGLGMPIIKNIMEEHHGGFEIKSKVEQGTVVTLWLPIQSH